MSTNQNRRPFLPSSLTRRKFLGTAATATAVAAVGGATLPAWADSAGDPQPAIESPESIVKMLYASLTDSQKKTMCFDWDFVHPKRGLLRTRLENNWRITPPAVTSAFYTPEQRGMVVSIFQKMLNPDWVTKIEQQLKDDTGGGFGHAQSIAIFGHPGADKFELVITGRHLTLRCDGHMPSTSPSAGPFSTATPPRIFTKRRTTPATSSGRRRWRQTSSIRCSTPNIAARL